MSMKRRIELSASPYFSAVSRALVIGGVLSLAMACARKDAAKTDSAVAASSSVTSTTTAMAAPATTPVESVSAGETSVSADSQKNASADSVSGAARTSSKSSASTTSSATPTHHTVHHSDSSATKRTAASPAHTSSSSSSTSSTASNASNSTTSASTSTPAAATTTTSTTASADTGEKAAADTSKKTASASGAADHLLVSPQEYEGWKMFSVYCYRCHGVDAMGGGIAPNLRHSVSSEGSVTHEVFIQTVTNGRLDKGMPSWKALLSPEQMEDLWQYINARSSGRLAPGRPHMAQGANP